MPHRPKRRPAGLVGGVRVTSLFKILDLCGVSQTTVCRKLNRSRPAVSLWARGHRPIPPKHLEPLLEIIQDTIGQTNDQYWEAMQADPASRTWWKTMPPIDLANSPYPYLWPPPEPEAPPPVQAWWRYHTTLMDCWDAWDAERKQRSLFADIGKLCGIIGHYARMPPDKRELELLGPTGEDLLDTTSRLANCLRAILKLRQAREADVSARTLLIEALSRRRLPQGHQP